jgi:hypothetical protein
LNGSTPNRSLFYNTQITKTNSKIQDEEEEQSQKEMKEEGRESIEEIVVF